MPLISIIVPVYNVERYLPQCIDSLLSQTLVYIEIILVNDGSTDSSLKICDQYAEKDRRIIIISKKNEGVAKARRDGLEKATAEYISFLDSDDYYEPMFCEKMYTHMVRSNADLVECDYYKVSDSWRMKHELYDAEMDLTKELFHNKIVRNTLVNGTEAVVVWNKLYRKCIIKRTILEYGSSPLEDYVFNIQYYSMVERYEYIHQCLTNYRQVPMSLSRKCNFQTYEILKKAEMIKEDCLGKMGLITEADKRDDAVWFVNYTINFLRQYLLTDIVHSDAFMRQVLTDDMFCQKCVHIAQENQFARLISNGELARALRQLKNNARLEKAKILLSRIKHMVLDK
ncbi:MAG: glycosyltransferase [Clostridia bacterium]|nr:glycosyltransferase [Clostridia bacterium]